ncbi:MAG: XdhC family protein, partial [Gammaproteobacteria bacterium]
MTQQADDITILGAALQWLREGRGVALATVIRTWGSSPRPPGSLLAMNDAGRFAG